MSWINIFGINKFRDNNQDCCKENKQDDKRIRCRFLFISQEDEKRDDEEIEKAIENEKLPPGRMLAMICLKKKRTKMPNFCEK